MHSFDRKGIFKMSMHFTSMASVTAPHAKHIIIRTV